ncbi:MAG: pyridoxine 5'-phosphate synthase, partial [Myxococcota bacterium]
MDHSAQLSRLSVNLNAVAYLRNRRDLPWPNLLKLARVAMTAGARGITVHPRPDARHIRRADVHELSSLFQEEFPDRDFALEGYPDASFLSLVEETRPQQVLFVPDAPEQPTSDHGWDLTQSAKLGPIIEKARGWGVMVSIFIDPDPVMANRAAELGADRVEIFTGPYGACHSNPSAAESELARVVQCATAGRDAGLGINAGHDLTLENIKPLIDQAPFIREVSIGHAFMACALEVGFSETVRLFRRKLGEPVD